MSLENDAQYLKDFIIGVTGNETPAQKAHRWALLEALNHILSVCEKQRWQPIETAPKDGTLILLLYYKHHAHFRGRVGKFVTSGKWHWHNVSDKETKEFIKSKTSGEWRDYTSRLLQQIPSKSKNKVTHWMPLPEPPEQALQSGGEGKDET